MKLLILLSLGLTLLPDDSGAQTRIWRQTNGPYGGDLTTMAVSPDGVVFAASAPDYSTNGGFSRSSDLGHTWTSIPSPGYYVSKMMVTKEGMLVVASDTSLFRLDSNAVTWIDITNGLHFGGSDYFAPQVEMIAQTHEALFVSIYHDGLYKSSNKGESWILMNSSDTVNSFIAIASDTSGILYGAGSFGVAKSIDSGFTWTLKNTGLEQTNKLVRTLVVDDIGKLHITINYGGFFTSTDQGESWTKQGDQISNADAFVISQTSGDFFCAYGGIILHSTNRGSDWQMDYEQSLIADIGHLQTDAHGILIAATYRGAFFSSTDNGITWSSSGLPNKYVRIAFDSTGAMYAGADWYISMSQDQGEHWRTINEGLPNQFAFNALSVIEPGRMFACTDSGLYQCRLDSLMWRLIESGLPKARTTACTISQSGVLLVGAQTGIYRSSDSGSSWNQTSSPPTTIRSFLPLPQGNILAGGNSGILQSTDGGLSWASLVGDSLLYGQISRLVRSPNGTLFAGGLSGVIRSTDDGKSWNRVLGDAYLGIDVSALEVTELGEVFASYDSIVHSLDNGTSWQYAGEGTWQGMNPLCFTRSPNGQVYAGTWYGVFATIAGTTDVMLPAKELGPASFSLSQNYPNPFNPVTEISCTVSERSNLNLSVYDIMGRVVAVLLEGVYSPGQYRVKFDGSGLASGVFFYRLQAGSHTETKKLILVK